MALPRYNPTQPENREDFTQVRFPFLLAPSDPPRKLGRVRHFLISPLIWKIIGGLAVVAFGLLVFFFLEPLATAGGNPLIPVAILALSSFLGILLVIRILLAFIGNRSARGAKAKRRAIPVFIPEVLPRKHANSNLAKEKTWLIWECEEWHTIPQESIATDETALQKATDILVAPDTMIVTLEVIEDHKAA